MNHEYKLAGEQRRKDWQKYNKAKNKKELKKIDDELDIAKKLTKLENEIYKCMNMPKMNGDDVLTNKA